ncbi:GNAT family N-acetyltransferase [Trinickia terrae]|uniref:GNAT family N-acetyltransferase n=1 Tax=Trinickia terrae TaxID=2571161 RepID=A0A4U1IDQ5_9BURK|nr:GNAT family N-acetyltransferase [Trinickia terrae]TKC91781.1 GNAT family N-acetyltransferase [Trinickia terrae]
MDTTISLKAYDADDAPVWDQIVRQSCNGNFLHVRNYMDYHKDRFMDCSVVLFRNGKPVAVFPASRTGTTVNSHGGLTYAGLIHTAELGAHDTLLAFAAIREHYLKQGVQSIIYKAIPQVFHRLPCQNDLYALTCAGATLMRRDASSVIGLDEPPRYSKGRKWAINKAKKSGITVRQSDDFEGFHVLLSHVLEKFGTSPVHSCGELRLLSGRFPTEIALYIAEHGDTLLAGTLVYDFGHIVHTQYMANSDVGRDLGALDFLLAEVIATYRDRKFFSFGISTEEQGLRLNSGLIGQKEAFGARTVVHDFYRWTL